MTKINMPEQMITLEECSVNDDKVPVTHLQDKVYCFDDLSQAEGDEYRRGKKLCSADGVYLNTDGNIFFFEFKNAPHNQVPYKSIYQKMHDSILTWQICQASDKSLDELMKKSTYFVIYNDSRYNGVKENESPSIEKMKSRMKMLAKSETESVLWGLDLFLGSFYKEIHTIDVEKFEREYAPKIFGVYKNSKGHIEDKEKTETLSRRNPRRL